MTSAVRFNMAFSSEPGRGPSFSESFSTRVMVHGCLRCLNKAGREVVIVR
jgi:hypothetical protein